jgi:hypothetical protein
MYFLSRGILVAGCFAVANLGCAVLGAETSKQVSSQPPMIEKKVDEKIVDQKQKASQDDWRYTFRNGEWYYWLPTNHWVYWRNHQWNNYDPKTFISRHAFLSTLANGAGSSSTGVALSEMDERPFYGHSVSTPDRRPLERNGEVGPFYGHTLPNEIFGNRTSGEPNRPSYGHAVSTSNE